TSAQLDVNPTGIGYSVDNSLNTDKQIFTVVGPHLGHYYGDIFLVFKREIMLHPDSHMSIQAATTFGPSMNAYRFRPWLTDPKTPANRIQQYHNTKLHCSIPGYERTAATELIALTGMRKRTMNIDLNSIKNHWMKIDSHEIFEGNLPQLIPLDYIDHIYMPRNVFQSLSSKAQSAAQKMFGKSLTITDHLVDLDYDLRGLDTELDVTRIPYQKYVINEINSTLNRMVDEASFLQGTMITLPPSHFKGYVMLPITISQSFYNYHRTNKKDVEDDNKRSSIWIYWEAMHGDMMVTISNSPIIAGRRQEYIRCLTCYVAVMPSNDAVNSQKSFTYLTAGPLIDHQEVIDKNRSSASSNTFHYGCNANDYVGYCLKINRQTGDVTLSYAGSNKVYNREIIKCQLSSQLNLSKLEYVHISAGRQTVPVRNMIIRHEPLHEWYQYYDAVNSIQSVSYPTAEQSSHWISTTLDLIIHRPQLISVLISMFYESIQFLCDENYRIDSDTYVRNSVSRYDLLIIARIAEHMTTYFCQCANECEYKRELQYALYRMSKLEDTDGRIACITILCAFGELTVQLIEILVEYALDSSCSQEVSYSYLSMIRTVETDEPLERILDYLKSSSTDIRDAASNLLAHLTRTSVIQMDNVGVEIAQIVNNCVTNK
ncbi:unnamed protein product, partial [Adineta ricciae]